MKQIISLLAITLFAGCTTSGIDRNDTDKVIKQYYAKVDNIAHVTLASQTQSAMAIGGAAGVIENLDGNHEEMIAGAFVGALFSGLVMSIVEGSDQAYQYHLTAADEHTFSVVRENNAIKPGQCVLVREAHKVTLNAVDSQHCQFERHQQHQAI